MWIIALSVLGTVAIMLLVANFSTPEKEPHHKVERLFDIKNPQMQREMGALLGPAIVPGNAVEALNNGDEIIPGDARRHRRGHAQHHV